MQHVTDPAQLRLDQPSMLAVGVFDGLHRGHQHLVGQLVREAHGQGWRAGVMTFHPHPDLVLGKMAGRYTLTTPQQRAQLLAELGVDYVITHPFDRQVMSVRAAAFIDRLLKPLRLRALWVGEDFALGHKREGDVPFLRAYGAQHGFDVRVVDLLSDGTGARISSSAVRAALNDGDVRQASALLGRLYQVQGVVIHGDKRGRTIGFPTANIAVDEHQLVPASGVYAGWATTDASGEVQAVANIGVRPTFGGEDLRLEVHLLDFDGDLYDQPLAFAFAQRLRGEQRFAGIAELTQQIGADVTAARTVLTAPSAAGRAR